MLFLTSCEGAIKAKSKITNTFTSNVSVQDTKKIDKDKLATFTSNYSNVTIDDSSFKFNFALSDFILSTYKQTADEYLKKNNKNLLTFSCGYKIKDSDASAKTCSDLNSILFDSKGAFSWQVSIPNNSYIFTFSITDDTGTILNFDIQIVSNITFLPIALTIAKDQDPLYTQGPVTLNWTTEIQKSDLWTALTALLTPSYEVNYCSDTCGSDNCSTATSVAYGNNSSSITITSDGSYVACLRAKIASSSTSWVSSASIVVNTTSPNITAVSIDSGAASTTSTTVNVSITSSNALTNASYCLREDTTVGSCSWSTWSSGSSNTYSYTFTNGTQGTKTIYAWLKDVSGSISSSNSDTITYTAPGAAIMATSKVQYLPFTASDNGTQYSSGQLVEWRDSRHGASPYILSLSGAGTAPSIVDLPNTTYKGFTTVDNIAYLTDNDIATRADMPYGNNQAMTFAFITKAFTSISYTVDPGGGCYRTYQVRPIFAGTSDTIFEEMCDDRGYSGSSAPTTDWRVTVLVIPSSGDIKIFTNGTLLTPSAPQAIIATTARVAFYVNNSNYGVVDPGASYAYLGIWDQALSDNDAVTLSNYLTSTYLTP